MVEGEKVALDDMVGRDKAEIMGSNYGKVKAAQIGKEKSMVGDTATRGVSAYAKVLGFATDDPATAFVGGLTALLGGRYIGKRMFGGLPSAGSGGGGGVAGPISGLVGGGVQKVFVTNPGFGGASSVLSTAASTAATTAGATAATSAATGTLGAAGGIEHRLTKFRHPWTNGQVEIMNRVIKDATTKQFHDEDVVAFKNHLMAILMLYNFQRL
jgi:hypothetical protein